MKRRSSTTKESYHLTAETEITVSTRGFANESEFTVVKVDFYNNIITYLSELNNTNIRNLADIVQFNYDNDGTEDGNP